VQRKVCIHGHFYQPDRADPWTGQVPPEPAAAPFHDWNERIAVECYRANAAARRLDADGNIDHIVCNYERMSWNAGPSLLSWLEQHEPWTYRAMVEADAAGADRFSGHGPALAQPWVHAILPLAPDRDKDTVIRWGLTDFERRFGRTPEGMWLPETAVDTPTLEALAAAGLAFTVLAPWQAAQVRAPGQPWQQTPAGPTGAGCRRGPASRCSSTTAPPPPASPSRAGWTTVWRWPPTCDRRSPTLGVGGPLSCTWPPTANPTDTTTASARWPWRLLSTNWKPTPT